MLYPGLNESLKHLRTQVIHSLPFAVKNLPALKTPEQVFNFCKSKYTYQSDPTGTELFMTVPTLLENNDFGNSGYGDCDDATIFTLTMLLRSNLNNCGIVLVGRSKYNPTHIYSYFEDENGNKKYLDLTNKKFNQVRPYPFIQHIPFKISPNQLNMFLQLADSPKRFKAIKTKKKFTRIATDKNNSVFIPSKNVYIPFKTFDKLKPKQASERMLSEGYEAEQINEYLSGRAERKARREARATKKKEKYEFKKEKRAQKIEKQKAKTEIKKARAEKKRSRGEAAKMRAEAKIIKSQAKYKAAEEGEESPGMKIFNKAGQLVSKIITREPEEAEEVEAEEVEAEEVETEQIPAQEIDETEELSEGIKISPVEAVLGLSFFAGLFIERKYFRKHV